MAIKAGPSESPSVLCIATCAPKLMLQILQEIIKVWEFRGEADPSLSRKLGFWNPFRVGVWEEFEEFEIYASDEIYASRRDWYFEETAFYQPVWRINSQLAIHVIWKASAVFSIKRMDDISRNNGTLIASDTIAKCHFGKLGKPGQGNQDGKPEGKANRRNWP
jgi:hypothetical protein